MSRFSVLSFAASVAAVAGFSVPVVLANQHNARLVELYESRKPEGSGPFPVVLLVAGCSGFKWKFYERAEARLGEMGFATIRVDSLGARDLSECVGQISMQTVAEDILWVLHHLPDVGSVKASSVNLLGWSFGGGGALQVLALLDRNPDAKVAAVAAFSPSCLGVDSWSAPVPVLMLLGGADDVAPPAFCRSLVGDGAAAAQVTIEEYENAHHGFDDEDLPPKKEFFFGTMGYHPAAATQAWKALEGFLVR